MADTWPSESIWVIMQLDKEGQKCQNIEESRAGAGAAYRQTSKIQMIHDDVHQLLEADFLVPSPELNAGPSQSHTEPWPLGF